MLESNNAAQLPASPALVEDLRQLLNFLLLRVLIYEMGITVPPNRVVVMIKQLSKGPQVRE